MDKMQKGVRVAIVEPVGGHGGMDYYDFGLCTGLCQAGIHVSLFTCDETTVPSNPEFEVNLSYKRIYGNDSTISRGVRYIFGSVKAMINCVKSGRIICHFHWFHVGPLELFNVLLAKLLFRKVIVTAHDVEAFAKGLTVPAFVKIAYKQCTAVIAHNKVSQNELVNKVGLSRQKISVIPHGNYLHAIKPLAEQVQARDRLAIPKNMKVLLFFGQIKEVKGLDLLLKSMRDVIKVDPNVLLLIAGKVWKTDFDYYDNLIEKYGIRKHCRLDIRYIPDNQVSDYYAAADMVILPYRKIYQSGVLLMAMSYGKAVVVSDLPGMTEIVTDNETGMVFQAGNVKHLSETLIKACNNPSMLAEYGKKSISLMREKYSWDSIGRLTANLYASCV